GQPRNEMVDGAGGCINGNALHRSPGGAIGGAGEDNVIRRAARTEAAVLPRHVDGSAAIHSRSWQGAAAQAAGFTVVADGTDRADIAPGGSAVGRSECLNSVALKGNDYGAVRLNQRLSTESESISHVCSRRPGCAAILGDAHPDLIAAEGVIPLDIAVSEESAARVGIARDPRLVGEPGIAVYS